MDQGKELGVIKYGSHAGFKISQDDNYVYIWKIGYNTMAIHNEIVRPFLSDMKKLLDKDVKKRLGRP